MGIRSLIVQVLQHGPVENALAVQIVVGKSILPIALRIKMGSGLHGISDSMHHPKLSGIVNGGQKLQRGMECGEAVARANCIRIGAVGRTC